MDLKKVSRSVATWLGLAFSVLLMAAAKPVVQMLYSEKSPPEAQSPSQIASLQAITAANLKYIEGSRLLDEANAAGKPDLGVKKASPLLDEARRLAQSTDRADLNSMYPGWGDIVFDKFVPGLDLLLSARTDADVHRAADLLDQVKTWHSVNSPKIAKKLR